VSFVLFVVLFFIREYLCVTEGDLCPIKRLCLSAPARHRLRLQARRAGGSAANWEFLCGRHFQLIQEFMEGSGGEVDHRGFGPKGYLVSIFQLIGLV